MRWVFEHPDAACVCDRRRTQQRSRRVMAKVGMRLEATLRLHRIDALGELADDVWYGMLRSEWEATV